MQAKTVRLLTDSDVRLWDDYVGVTFVAFQREHHAQLVRWMRDHWPWSIHWPPMPIEQDRGWPPVPPNPPDPPWAQGPTPAPFPVAGPLPEPWKPLMPAIVAAGEAVRLVNRIFDAAATTSLIGAESSRVLEDTAQEWASQLADIDDGDGTGKLPLRPLFPSKWWIRPPVPRPNELLIDPIVVPVAAGVAFSELGAAVTDESVIAAADSAAATMVRSANALLDRFR